MEPLEIRIALLRADIKQSEIARNCKVSKVSVGRVIDGHSTSDRIQRVIAKAIGQSVEDVFPDRYGRKAKRAREIEQKLAS